MKICLYTLLSLLALAPVAHALEPVVPTSLVAAVAKQHRIPEVQAAEQIQRIFATIRSELKVGRNVDVDNFGRFSVQERKLPSKKSAANVQANAQAQKAGTRKYAKFSPAEVLKIDINQRPS